MTDMGETRFHDDVLYEYYDVLLLVLTIDLHVKTRGT